jgi:hypothetical protein
MNNGHLWKNMKWWQSPRKEVDLMLYVLKAQQKRFDLEYRVRYEREFGKSK